LRHPINSNFAQHFPLITDQKHLTAIRIFAHQPPAMRGIALADRNAIGHHLSQFGIDAFPNPIHIVIKIER
jgi:hypothetical protein